MRKLKNSTLWSIMAVAVIATCGAFIYTGRARARGAAIPTQKAKQELSEQTRQNLSTAMRGEAFAFAKYMLYAEHARQTGHPELATLFDKTAHTERFEHFAEEARLAGLVGSDEANLRDAIKGESYEVGTMYKEFAEQASAAGDQAAAERFSEIRQDEMKHRDAYKAALAKLEKESAQLH
ncbi:MAG TPA: ferritin family protein [Terriglobia bacterium]|nr:ferritin family protein [Terriglobia bacterium]